MVQGYIFIAAGAVGMLISIVLMAAAKKEDARLTAHLKEKYR